MNGLDYRLVGETIFIFLGTVLVLLLALLAFRRAREVQGLGYSSLNRNSVLARVSFWSTIVAFIFATYYILFGHNEWCLWAVAALLILSVVATVFIRLPRVRERSNWETIQHHTFFAWPWRHKWIIIPAAFGIALFCILVYSALHDNKYGLSPAVQHTNKAISE